MAGKREGGMWWADVFGRCTSDHAVEILWVKLKVLETLS
jgi:hypothetical protein